MLHLPSYNQAYLLLLNYACFIHHLIYRLDDVHSPNTNLRTSTNLYLAHRTHKRRSNPLIIISSQEFLLLNLSLPYHNLSPYRKLSPSNAARLQFVCSHTLLSASGSRILLCFFHFLLTATSHTVFHRIERYLNRLCN